MNFLWGEMNPELFTYLGRRLCGDVAKIIEEYVVGQSRRMVAAYRAVIDRVVWKADEMECWSSKGEFHVWTVPVDIVKIYYKSGIKKIVDRCPKCGSIWEVEYVEGKDGYICSEGWEMCQGVCVISDSLDRTIKNVVMSETGMRAVFQGQSLNI